MTQQNLLFHRRDRSLTHREFVSPPTLSIVVQYQDDGMVQDSDSMDGFPTVVSSDDPGTYSPCSNVHLKHGYSPCTTQASLAAITDIVPSLDGVYLPTTLPPQVHETHPAETVASSSQNQDDRRDRTECGGSPPTPPQLGREQHSQDDQYSPDNLPQRMQDLQTSHSTEFDSCSLDTVFKPADGSILNSRPSLAYKVDNCSDRPDLYDLDVQTQSREGWAPWEHCPTPQEAPYQQSIYHTSRFDLPSSMGEVQPTSSPFAAVLGESGQSCQTDKGGDLGVPPMHGPYEHRHPADGIPMTALSPCSSTLAMGSDALCIGQEDTAPLPGLDIDMDTDMVYNPGLYDAEDALRSRSSAEPAGGKSDEPYAQLIHRAFLSRPNKSMTLQEIYQWFRENTDKAKSTGKGWQNSIRHNLSMNGVGDYFALS